MYGVFKYEIHLESTSILLACWAARLAVKTSPSALTVPQCGCRYSVARIAFRHDWLREVGGTPSMTYSWLTETTEKLAEKYDCDVNSMWDFAVVRQMFTSLASASESPSL